MGCVLQIVCLAILQTSPPSCPLPSSPAPPPVMSGNGCLTIGVDGGGSVSVCRWPGPGYCDQIQPGRSGEGLTWIVRLGDKALRLGSGAWECSTGYADDDTTVCQSHMAVGGAGIRATLTTFVHARKDILVSRLVVEGADTPPLLYWLAGLSPRNQLIPELPLLSELSTAGGGFAVFTPNEGKTMFHFRPASPGTAEWARVDELVQSSMSSQAWAEFGKGVWMGSETLDDVRGFECGPEKDSLLSAVEWTPQNLKGATAARGPGYSIQAIAPSSEKGTYAATSITAFGEDVAQVETLLAYARGRSYEGLLDETRSYWRDRVGQASLPTGENIKLSNACRRDILTLLQSVNVRTGAVVVKPVGPSWQAIDRPRAGAWITLALDMAGYADLADSHTWFYARRLRERDARGAPAGSLPAALYANGKEAVPSIVLEPDTVAWMLAAIWRHAGFLDEQPRSTYLANQWGAVEQAATFLSGWADTLTREPLPSFNARKWRDTASTDLLLTSFMGMDSALRIATVLKKEVPDEWKNRKLDLDILLRFHCVAEGGRWKADTILPFWAPEFCEAGLPSWEAAFDGSLASVPENIDAEFLEALCGAAMFWQDSPERLARLRSLLDRTQPPPSPDTLLAALHYLGALLTDGTVRVGTPKPQPGVPQAP